jgi:DNA-binding IclR family transcriptional regulator
MASKGTKPVGALVTTFDVLEALKALDGAGVTELSNHLEIPKSTVHSHLNTLEEHGYVTNSGDEYRLGLKLLNLGGYAREQRELYQTAKPEIEELGERTGEWANLLVEEHGRGIYLHVTKGDRAVELDVYPGKQVYLHSTALGKAILSHMSDEEVRRVIDLHGLPGVSDQTVTDETALFERLDEVRDRGYAYDREERLQGLRCVAAPVIFDNDHVVGAVSVSGPTGRLKGEWFEEELPEVVTNIANVIGINLTYS